MVVADKAPVLPSSNVVAKALGISATIPENIIKRIDSSEDQRAEGKKICAEILGQLSEINGVGGAHLMGPNSEQAVAEIIQTSGILDSRAIT